MKTSLAFVVLTICTVARAAPAGDKDALDWISRWADAQNRGDFAAYSKLYAPQFHGVRRTSSKKVELDRDGWLKDRARMFQRHMKVEVLDPRVSGEAGKVTVELVQTYTDDRYRDRGRKRLTLERQNGVLLIAHEELFESQAPESGKECSETSGTAGAGTLLLRTCVIASKERTFKDDRLKRVTLTYRTVSGSSVETALAPVSDGWEWDQQWAIAGTLTDASGARAVVLRKLSGDVAFEWNELEVRALSPGLPVLWTSKDVFMQPAFDERGDKITVVAKRGAITKDDDMGKLETASPTTTTLRFTGGKVSESK